jgi:hypothetical protein
VGGIARHISGIAEPILALCATLIALLGAPASAIGDESTPAIDCNDAHEVMLRALRLDTEGDAPDAHYALSLKCDKAGACSAQLSLRIDNCGSQAASVVDVYTTDPSGAARPISLACARGLEIPAAESRTLQCPLPGNEAWRRVYALVTRAGAESETNVVGFRVRQPPPPGQALEQEECRRCHGDWGTRGKAQLASCRCRAKTRGRACQDSDECDGECLVTTKGDRETGKKTSGRCSENRGSELGCHWVVRKGKAVEKCVD